MTVASPELARVDTSNKPILEINNLHASFYTDEGVVRAVRGVSLSVAAGQTLGVVGESGCGKSVTAHAILQLIQAPGRIDNGDVWLHRHDDSLNLTKLDRYSTTMRQVRGGDIAMIFQEPMTALSPVHTIGQQIVEAIRLHEPMSKRQARIQATDLLDRVRIPNPSKHIDAYTFELSGGMRQRAMIAMALASSPSVLIADEPTTALDVTTQARILDLLQELQARYGMALVLITHDLGVVASMADEVAVMYLGAVVEQAPVGELFHDPKHPYTRALLRSVPTIKLGESQPLAVIPGVVPPGTHVPQGCAFAGRCREVVAGLCEQVPPATIILNDAIVNNAVNDEGNNATRRVACHLEDPVQQHHLPNDINQNNDEVSKQGLQPQLEDHTKASQLIGVDTQQVDSHSEAPSSTNAKITNIVLDIDNLSVHYPVLSSGILRRKTGVKAAVDEVSLTLHAGEALGLVGESGCGKSSLAHALVRLTKIHGGTVHLEHELAGMINVPSARGDDLKIVRQTMRMIFQDPYSSLDPRLSVRDVVGESISLLTDIPKRERDSKIAQLLTDVGLSPGVMRRYVHAFSGGQRQRISIARALATDPRVLIADEAVSALDVSVQAQVLNVLRDLQQSRKLTMLFISHDLAVISAVCERVAVMYAGRIVEIAAKDELFSQPQHPYTETLLQAILPPEPAVQRSMETVSENLVSSDVTSQGCAFAPRCRFATELCQQVRPELREVNGREVACHHAEEVVLEPYLAKASQT
ncbi:MAG: ABC transporter ATP-binding protein [Deinococcota bacterium]